MKIRKTTNEIKRKYNYVYKLTLKSNPAIFYIGKRSTDKENDDQYMGSGKALKYYKEKYGKDCFNKEILSYWNTSEEALLEEKRLVTRELIEDENCLNRIIGGGAFDTLGCKWGPRTEEQNKRNSESHKGIKQSEETKKKRAESIKRKWQESEYREAQKYGRQGKYETHLSKLTDTRLGQVCLTKNNKWKYVNKDDVDAFLSEGWVHRGAPIKPSYEQILAYRETGLSYQQIGDIYGVKESCVRKWRKRYEENLA